MYEHVTYESIMERMTKRVRETSPNIDTREGSVIFNALAPAALELQLMYIELDRILDETFADTETRAYLIRRCRERGIEVEEATYALRLGVFNMDIPIGSRFSLNKLNYIAERRIEYGLFDMRCETAGYAGNLESGKLIPIEYIQGLTKAELTDVLIPGEDEEDTEHLRERYMNSLKYQAFGGNIADYQEKVNAIQGVGGVKVYPVWRGGGTVRLVVIDSMHRSPSPETLELVQTSVDPIQNQGEGVGVAPIGHVVTVDGVSEDVINISTVLTFTDGITFDDVGLMIYEIIDGYFLELSKTWVKYAAMLPHLRPSLVVRVSQIESRLLEIPSIIDIKDTHLNGQEENITLHPDAIPVRGDFECRNS